MLIISVYFAYFVLLKIFYLIGRGCNYTFCVTASAMMCTHGTTVKMLQNTLHRGLILRKVSINDKDNYKTVTKNATHMVLSICNYFLLEFTVMKELVYLCMQYRSLPLKEFL